MRTEAGKTFSEECGFMEQLIECVPNFSEGRDEGVISAITSEISATDGVYLLDVDPGKDTNRTVVTFVGTPDEVIVKSPPSS